MLLASPDNPLAAGMLGIAELFAGQHEQGLQWLDKAIELQPENHLWHSNRCSALRWMNRISEAVQAGARAVQLEGANGNDFINLGLALEDYGDYSSARLHFLRAIGIEPENANAHIAMSQNLLAKGEYAPGWIEYTWVEVPLKKNGLPLFSSAKWNGMELPTGNILLIADQGYGDTFQFARYISLVRERCAKIFIGCSEELKPLLSPLGECYSRWDEIPGHAAHVRLSACPGLFNTAFDAVPNMTPYLGVPRELSRKWAEKLPHGQLLVGLCWNGRKTHPNNGRRSVGLDYMLPLLNMEHQNLPQPLFVSLQKPWNERPGYIQNVIHFTDELTDWRETAALISNLDLVISIDSGVAHLAGAMDIPTWVMLPKNCDWRWCLDGNHTPWYPSARLFRQSTLGDWSTVVQEAKQALVAWQEESWVSTCSSTG